MRVTRSVVITSLYMGWAVLSAMLWHALHAVALTVPSAPTALLQPLSPAAKLQRLSGLLLGGTLLQDARTWDLLLETQQQEASGHLAEIVGAAHVGPSPRDALGLFASRDLASETVVSFYPVHSIGLLDQRLASNADDREYWRTCPAAYRTPLLHEAVHEFAPGAFVDVNLQRAEVAGWLAHRANDAAACAGRSETEVLGYIHTCALECNSVLVPFGGAAPILALVTTREVAEGEELLCCYGLEHWAQRASADEAGAEPAEGAEPELSPAAQDAVDAFRAEQERTNPLGAVLQRYEADIGTFESMIVLAAEDMAQKQPTGGGASAAAAASTSTAPAATNRKLRRSTKKAAGSRGGAKAVKKKRKKRK